MRYILKRVLVLVPLITVVYCMYTGILQDIIDLVTTYLIDRLGGNCIYLIISIWLYLLSIMAYVAIKDT